MPAQPAEVQVGEVYSVDPSGKTVKVLHTDASGSVSTELPIMRPKPRPDVGDPVAVVYLSNGAAYGICLGTYYDDDNPPPENGRIIEVAVLPDGASIQYDTVNKVLILNAENVTVQATDQVNITGAQGVTIQGKNGNQSW